MQDAHTGDWVWESQLPARLLGSLQELNLRFLGLRAGPGGEFGGQAAPLSPAQRLAVAGCPYALFDLKFQDDGHWCPRLQNAAPWRVADAAMGEPEAVEFVHLALFFAWHVASTAKLAAQLILGMNEATALAFRRITVDRLPQLAASETPNLGARWSDCARSRCCPPGSRRPAARPAVRRAAGRRRAVARRPDRTRRRGDDPGRERPEPQMNCRRSLARFTLGGSYASSRPTPAHEEVQERRPGAEGHRSRGG